MEVSDAKSQAILVLRGTLSTSIRRKYVCKGTDGPILRVPLLSGSLKIPLVQQFRYLGTQVNYTAFENSILEFRLQKKGDAVYRRLSTILRGKHYLSSVQRLHLWRACIWTTMSYGLVTCGITPAGHKLLETKIVRQIWAILRLPAHLTFTTNTEVMQQAGLQLPRLMLETLLTREGDKKCQGADAHVCLPTSEWWHTVQQSLRAQPESSQLIVAPTPARPQPCPECGVFYSSRATLLTHIAKCHPDTVAKAPPEPYHRSLDSIGGLPQCSTAKRSFPHGSYFAGMLRVITVVFDIPFCRNRPQHLSSQHPLCHRSLQIPWNRILLASMPLTPSFMVPNRHLYRQHCLVCGQWVASSKVMKLHYQHSHPGLYKQHNSKTEALCATYTGCGSPCLYCDTSVAIPRLHKLACTTLWQFCINLSATNGGGGPGDQGSLRRPGSEQSPELRGSPLRDRESRPGQGATAQGAETGACIEQAPKALRQCRLSWLPRPVGQQRSGQGQQAAERVSMI